MPNWVYNTLTIEGEAERIDEVVAQLNKPFTKQFSEGETTYSNPIIAFWNISKPSDDILDEYIGTASGGNISNPNNWYSWNNANWGTKWDIGVADDVTYDTTSTCRETPNSVSYSFETAWSPPEPVMITLSQQYPDLELTLEYQEEQGWGGEVYFSNGMITTLEHYTWKCGGCAYGEPDNADENYCETCEDYVCPKCDYGKLETCNSHAKAEEEVWF